MTDELLDAIGVSIYDHAATGRDAHDRQTLAILFSAMAKKDITHDQALEYAMDMFATIDTRLQSYRSKK